MSFRAFIRIEQKGDFVETESSLKMFYRSGEPETTRNFSFPVFNCSFVVKDSGKGLGVFLEKPAVPGQLLILSKAVTSCECTREKMTYEKDSYVHSPRVQWTASGPRIPQKIYQHLGYHLAKTISEASTSELAMINLLDSHQYAERDAQEDEIRGRVTKRRLIKGLLELSLPESEGHKLEILDTEKVRNMISNNAVCDKVRALSLDETGIVETCEAWGLWVIPSWINHSCSPNCHRIRVGDSMLIRAATDIEAGDELTLPYFDIFQPVSIRELDCKFYGFRCECCRCQFERSIGKPYHAIEEEIMKLKLQMQTMWTFHVMGGPGLTNTLLEKLGDQILPINILIDKLRDWTLWDTDNHTEQTSSAKQEGELPMSHPGSASEAALDYFASEDDIYEFWIKASFIEAYIAVYSQCELGFFRFEDPSVPFGRLVTWHEGAVSESEEVTRLLRVVKAALKIVDIIEYVHPGNMLGQEFYSIEFKACSEFVLCDLLDNYPANVRFLESSVQSDALRFFSRYYGFVDVEILRLLIATEP